MNDHPRKLANIWRWFFICALFWALTIYGGFHAFAQVSGGVTSVGPVTPGHVAVFKSKSQVQDGGTPSYPLAQSNLEFWVGLGGSDSNSGLAAGTATTNSGTATSSAVLNFASVPSFVAANQMAWDSTNKSFLGTVSSKGTGTVTLSAVVPQTVTTGDVIIFSTPFLTIQHAINVASGYNYNNLFSPIIISGGGIFNQELNFPQFLNTTGNETLLCDGGGIGTTIADVGVSYGININGGNWSFDNCGWQGTYGGISINSGGVNILDGFDFGSESGLTASQFMLQNGGGSFNIASGATIFPSQNARGFSFTRGFVIFNNALIVVLGNLAFSSPGSFLAADAYGGFYGMVGTQIFYTDSGGSITSGGGIGLTSNAFLECDAPGSGGLTTVDGVQLTSLNVPGHGTNDANNWNVFSQNECDNIAIVAVPAATGSTITMADAQLNQILAPTGNVTSMALQLPAVNSGVPWSHQVTISNSSANNIATLTITALDGKTVNGAPTSLLAKTSVRFQFDATTLQWYVQ